MLHDINSPSGRATNRLGGRARLRIGMGTPRKTRVPLVKLGYARTLKQLQQILIVYKTIQSRDILKRILDKINFF